MTYLSERLYSAAKKGDMMEIENIKIENPEFYDKHKIITTLIGAASGHLDFLKNAEISTLIDNDLQMLLDFVIESGNWEKILQNIISNHQDKYHEYLSTYFNDKSHQRHYHYSKLRYVTR